MRKLITILVIMGSMATMWSCAPSSDTTNDKIEYYPIKVESDQGWSFIDPEGQVCLDDEFDNEPTIVVDGYFSVKEREGYTVYKFDKKHPKPILEGLAHVGYYNNGLIGIVQPLGRITFADGQGEVKFTLGPIDGKEIVLAASEFGDGLLLVENSEHKYGFVDTKGRVVIKPIYDAATEFGDGYALTLRTDKDGKYVNYIINTKGEEVAQLKSDYDDMDCPPFKHGLTPVTQTNDGESRCGFLNTKGEFKKLPSKVHEISEYNDKVVVYWDEDEKYGVMTLDGQELIRPKYEYLRILDDNKYLAERNGKYLLINSDGDKLESDLDDYSEIKVLPGKGFKLLVKDGGVYSVANYEGKQVGKAEFVDYGYTLSPYYYLKSEYFDVKALADAIIDEVKTDGIGRYKIGKNASHYLSDPSKYYGKYNIMAEDAPAPGFRYDFSLQANFTEEISGYTWADSYGASYFFNPDSNIWALYLEARPETDIWSQLKPLLVDRLEAKGFSVTENESDKLIMKCGEITLKIAPNNNKVGVLLYTE